MLNENVIVSINIGVRRCSRLRRRQQRRCTRRVCVYIWEMENCVYSILSLYIVGCLRLDMQDVYKYEGTLLHTSIESLAHILNHQLILDVYTNLLLCKIIVA